MSSIPGVTSVATLVVVALVVVALVVVVAVALVLVVAVAPPVMISSNDSSISSFVTLTIESIYGWNTSVNFTCSSGVNKGFPFSSNT